MYVESRFEEQTRKEFTMTNTTHQAECNSATLYVALELAMKEWALTLTSGPGGKRVRMRVRPGDREGLRRALTHAKARLALPPTAPIRSCYEAGRDGFWPHRLLSQIDVLNLVVDSSSIEVPRRARRAKTDRLDGEKLVRLLLRYWSGERDCWHVVHVPTPAVEDARHESRSLTTLQQERTRYRNRIHSLLAVHGVAKLRIDDQFAARLAAARDWAGDPLRPGCRHGCWRRGACCTRWKWNGGPAGARSARGSSPARRRGARSRSS
jgi:hypothetical protein